MYRKFIPVYLQQCMYSILQAGPSLPAPRLLPLLRLPPSLTPHLPPQRFALGTKAGVASANISHPPNECQWSHVLSLNLCNEMDGDWGGGWSRAEHRIHSLDPSWTPPDEGEAGIVHRPPAAQGRWLGTGLRRPSHAPHSLAPGG